MDSGNDSQIGPGCAVSTPPPACGGIVIELSSKLAHIGCNGFVPFITGARNTGNTPDIIRSYALGMTPINSLCVYCGSSRGNNPAFLKLATELGTAMAARDTRLIYGGGRVGLMGACADAVMANGGQVIGVIPQHLQDREVGHTGLTELKVVDNMHTRKRMMFDLSDAFCVLPGGLGTLEEFFEVVTWRQLGIHDKPIILLNAEGYWDRLIGMMDGIIADGFAQASARQFYSVANSVGRLFDLLAAPADTQEPDYPERL